MKNFCFSSTEMVTPVTPKCGGGGGLYVVMMLFISPQYCRSSQTRQTLKVSDKS